MKAAPLLWLVIGPNGAGKSTYYETRIRPHLAAEFVNADAIGRARWPRDAVGRAYDAARLAETRRRELIDLRRSFVAETVCSHPSKLALLADARAAGYRVWVSFICLETPQLAVARVAERVARGGHAVPHDKIRGRYDRMAAFAVAAVEAAHRGYVLDNSDPTRPLRDVLGFDRGQRTFVAPHVPAWARRLFARHLPEVCTEP